MRRRNLLVCLAVALTVILTPPALNRCDRPGIGICRGRTRSEPGTGTAAGIMRH